MLQTPIGRSIHPLLISADQSKTFDSDDMGSVHYCATSGPITLLIPKDSTHNILPGRSVTCHILASQYTIQAEVDVTINNLSGVSLSPAPIGVKLELYKSASNSWDVWMVSGDGSPITYDDLPLPGIRDISGVLEARNSTNTALASFRAASITARTSAVNASVDLITTATTAGVEVKGSGGIAYFDFGFTTGVDYHARFQLISATELQFIASGGLKYCYLAPLEAHNTFSLKNGSFLSRVATATQSADRIFTLPAVSGDRDFVVKSGAVSAGSILIGNTTSDGPFTLGTLTQGTGVSITNGDGSISIAVAALLAQIITGFSGAAEGSTPTKSGGDLVYSVPSGGTGGTALPAPVELTVTALNTLSALPSAPTATGKIILYVNGKAEFAVGTSPAFSVSGTTITWNAETAKYSLLPSPSTNVVAVVW